MPPLPARYADVVRQHRGDTLGLLLATQVECRDLVDQEVLRIERRLRPVEPQALSAFKLPASWLMAVIFCDGDDTALLAEWAARLDPVERDRIRFYQRPRAEVGRALEAWVGKGLDPPRVVVIRDFATFHKAFGRHLNDRVWMDHRG